MAKGKKPSERIWEIRQEMALGEDISFMDSNRFKLEAVVKFLDEEWERGEGGVGRE